MPQIMTKVTQAYKSMGSEHSDVTFHSAKIKRT